MKKLTYVLFLFAIIFSARTASAQHADSARMHRWFHHDIAGAAQIQLTYRQLNLSGVNNALINNGLPPIKENSLWINASMSHIWDKWYMEDGIGFTPIESSTSPDNIRSKFNQYQAFFRWGYNVSQTKDFRLFPFVGANFSAAVLNIEDKGRIQSTGNFQDEILNTTASKTFYQPNFGIELGAGFDYLIKVKPKQMDCFTVQRNIPIGFRAGYYINAYAGDWKIDSYKLQNSPNQKNSAVFVSFNIGLGYEVKK